jgi:hypothetical protein
MVKSSCVDKEKSRHKIEIIDGKKAAQCFNWFTSLIKNGSDVFRDAVEVPNLLVF